jgi:hypothetical protein
VRLTSLITTENRSAGGPSNGQMKGVRSGTSSVHDRADRYLHNYLRLADRELTRFLGGAMLVLTGVVDDVAAYQRASEYPNVLEAGNAGVEHLTWRDIGEIAQEAMGNVRRVEGEKTLDQVRETARRDHIVSGIREYWKPRMPSRSQTVAVPRRRVAVYSPAISDCEAAGASAGFDQRGGRNHTPDNHVVIRTKWPASNPVAAI